MRILTGRNRAFLLWSILLAMTLALSGFGRAQDDRWDMVVCADPHAMPLSDRNEEGYENRIAEVLAEHLGADLVYDWYPFGPDLIDLRLRAGECDLVMGIPDGQEPFLSTITYYLSPFVFVYRSDSRFELDSLDDPELADLRIGLQDTEIAPHDSLIARGLADNIVANYGSERYAAVEDPLARLVEAVAAGDIDVGISWGPPAGYYAMTSEAELEVVPLPTFDTHPPFTSLVTPMTMGVRRGDEALRDRLNIALIDKWDEIQAILDEYAVPRQPLTAPALGDQQDRVSVGLVGPVQTGGTSIAPAVYDIVGAAMRQGGLLAEDDIAVGSGALSIPIEVLLATTPSAEAAERAANRLVLLDGVDVLVGGVGEGQAEVLAKFASERDVLFINVGSQSATLRHECIPQVFHVEASADMYIDGLVEWYASQGMRRWFIVYEETEEGRRQYELALDSIKVLGGADAVVVGSAEVATEQPVYQRELAQAREEGADVILLLVNALDQIPFLAQQTTFGPELPVAPFPHSVTQSRNFMSAAAHLSHAIRSNRIAVWDATLTRDGAAELNERYQSRWGSPMEPQAWAAYAAVQILHQALKEVGSADAAALIEYLQRPDVSFDIHKGIALSFRPWNHQLRQPLYITTGEDSPWGVNVSQQVAVASLAGTVPAMATPDDPVTSLEVLGSGEAEFRCR